MACLFQIMSTKLRTYVGKCVAACLVLGALSEAGKREVLLQRFVTAALRTVDDDGVPLVFNTLPPTTTSSLHQYL
jgi:hypothetical protein